MCQENYKNGNIEPYKGVLYGSFMKVKNKSNQANPNNIYVIEFNCRFGDPETINLCHLIDVKKTNFNMILKSASATNTNIELNSPITKKMNYQDFIDLNKTKRFKLSKFNWIFKNEISLSKYLVDKTYPYTDTNSNILELDITKESYWIKHKNIITASINYDSKLNIVKCNKSRCFAFVISYDKMENINQIEKQHILYIIFHDFILLKT